MDSGNLEINPLIVDETGAVATDARIVIDQAPVPASTATAMAIHPLPGPSLPGMADGRRHGHCR